MNQKYLASSILSSVPALVVFAPVAHLFQPALAETFAFSIVKIVGCNNNGCSINVLSATGNYYNVVYGEKTGVKVGDRVLIDINNRVWTYITNPKTGKTLRIISAKRL